MSAGMGIHFHSLPMTTEQSLAPAINAQPEFEIQTTSGSLMLAGGAAFAHIQRVAKMFAASDLIPEQFRGNTANCTIALEMAHRMGANPMAVMQNLYIVHGRPGWSSQFIIACLNQCGKFSPLRFRIVGDGDNRECIAWAKEIETGEILEGPPVSIGMAKAEGWYSKNGSKWKTMPDLMLRYRAAAFFGRMYAPDLLMGMHTADEIVDVGTRVVTGREVPAAEVPRLFGQFSAAPVSSGAGETTAEAPGEPLGAASPATAEFWSKCQERGWDDLEVLAVLKGNGMTDAEFPGDISEDEAVMCLEKKAFAALEREMGRGAK